MRILRTAFTIFILDGLYPMVINFNRLGWNAPRRVMQSVAAGVLGKASFDGGIPTALLGTALHFTIATIWTSIFAFVVLRLPIVQRLTQTTKGTAVVGATYGGFIWLWMNYVVIALSRATVAPASKWPFWSQLVWHMVGVGPVIVFMITANVRARAQARVVAVA